ncbi:hypothetical protein T05_5274 [Trichinella murrelli]|uniref:Uncharacterized protein n=1 Tax=Trichinella murrelli TaxID=144512 RepID=A0A0V0TDW9_9BILA|nr:hypothetical protein T05_5274 [Trichinella murrelli]
MSTTANFPPKLIQEEPVQLVELPSSQHTVLSMPTRQMSHQVCTVAVAAIRCCTTNLASFQSKLPTTTHNFPAKDTFSFKSLPLANKRSRQPTVCSPPINVST